MGIESLVKSYPRTRPPLPPELQSIYKSAYLHSREGSSLIFRIAQLLEGWMHWQCARRAKEGQLVLEIGAGTLNQLAWEPANETFHVVEPSEFFYKGRQEANRVQSFFTDIAEVPAGNSYDRIISVAVLEHVLDLPMLLAKAALLLAPQGEFLAGIPTEGGALWGISWRLTAAPAFWLRTHQSYQTLLRNEHVSNERQIVALLRHFFEDCSVRRFPTSIRHVSLYTFLRCRRPRISLCREMAAVDR